MPKCVRKSKMSVTSPFDSLGEDLPVRVPIQVPTDEKPLPEITLADLLQCSPDVLTVSNRGVEHRVSIFDTFRRRPSPNHSHSSNVFGPPYNSISHGLSLEASNLTLPNTPPTYDLLDNRNPKTLWKNKDESECDKSTKVTPALPQRDVKCDLEVLSLRSVLDKKIFYKSTSSAIPPPKYFQLGGRVIKTPTTNLYHSKGPRRPRRKNIGDEMVAEISSTVSHL